MAVSNPNLSYPKPRTLQRKIFAVARTDSSTVKCVLPKGAIIVGVFVHQTVNASTAAGAVTVGWSGDTDGVLNAFSMATTAVGFVAAGTAIGSGVNTPLDSDKAVISTYTVGSSTAGGTGFVYIDYFMPGPGESVDD
jgi:hypothetical protein